jgi:hypothetical protein
VDDALKGLIALSGGGSTDSLIDADFVMTDDDTLDVGDTAATAYLTESLVIGESGNMTSPQAMSETGSQGPFLEPAPGCVAPISTELLQSVRVDPLFQHRLAEGRNFKTNKSFRDVRQQAISGRILFGSNIDVTGWVDHMAILKEVGAITRRAGAC